MTNLLKLPNLATRAAASVIALLALTPLAGYAETPAPGMTASIAAANLGGLDLLAPRPAQSQQISERGVPATQRYPFTEIKGWHLSHGWFFGKPARGRLGFVWENPEAQASLSTIALSTKGLRFVRRF